MHVCVTVFSLGCSAVSGSGSMIVTGGGQKKNIKEYQPAHIDWTVFLYFVCTLGTVGPQNIRQGSLFSERIMSLISKTLFDREKSICHGK